jgi:hypothetical protein
VGAQAQTDPTAGWRRRRHHLSISDPIWDAAKQKWVADRYTYPAWSDWVEAALDAKINATRKRYGLSEGQEFPPAPETLPTGRRKPPSAPQERIRRGFTCAPAVWQKARDAWYADLEEYSDWADWGEDAVAEFAGYTPPERTT